MSQSPKPRGLGRGLAALLGDEDIAAAVAQPAPPSPDSRAPEALRAAAPRGPITTLPITALRPGKYQPRTNFEGIDLLVDSVRQFGLLQPILVRPLDGLPGEYEIIAGERRWQAAQRVPLHEIPVVVRTLDDFDALQLALVENLQRADLSSIEEAKGYRRMIDDFNQTQETIARTMGRSRPHIANTLRLLDLPPDVQDMLAERALSPGVARGLLVFSDPLTMARRVVAEGLTARDIERLAANEKKSRQPGGQGGAQGATKPGSAPAASAGGKSGDTKALEKRIEEVLGLRADLQQTGKGEQCRLTLEIRDYDQLDTVVERLTRR
jgi:ParB family chromosome partitioning protein